MNFEPPDDFGPTGRQYDSVEDMLRGENFEPEVIHMTLELIARDEGTNNPQTDQRVDLQAMNGYEESL